MHKDKNGNEIGNGDILQYVWTEPDGSVEGFKWRALIDGQELWYVDLDEEVVIMRKADGSMVGASHIIKKAFDMEKFRASVKKAAKDCGPVLRTLANE